MVADWNGDGRDDFVIGTGREVLIFRSQGANDPQLTQSWLLPNSEHLDSMAAADFNENGLDDLLVCSENLRIYANQNGGQSFVQLSERFVDLPARELVIGDIDGNLTPDVIISRAGSLLLFPVVAAVAQDPVVLSHQLPGVPALVFGDIDGDLDEDIVLFMGESGQYQIFRRNGPSQFDAEPPALGGPATDLADVNGDGLLDGVCCGGGGSAPVENDLHSKFEVEIPFGDGFRCVGAGGVSTFRLYPSIPASPEGTVARHLDFNAAPASGGPGEITPGSTWYFQYWYRDPQGPGGSGVNLSDGPAVSFLPWSAHDRTPSRQAGPC